MFKTLAVAMLAAVAAGTEISLEGALVTQDMLTEYGTLRKDEPLITPEAKIPAELEGVKTCAACTTLVKAVDSFI
jgi:hypothetical protein